LPAKAASLALQCFRLHPGFGYRRAWEYGREPCAESQAFLCGATHFLNITGREPCGDLSPTRIIPGAIASRTPLIAPSVSVSAPRQHMKRRSTG